MKNLSGSGKGEIATNEKILINNLCNAQVKCSHILKHISYSSFEECAGIIYAFILIIIHLKVKIRHKIFAFKMFKYSIIIYTFIFKILFG